MTFYNIRLITSFRKYSKGFDNFLHLGCLCLRSWLADTTYVYDFFNTTSYTALFLSTRMRGNMPGLITHYLFGKDTYNYIHDDRIKNTIAKYKDAYNLGLQGADFYFYDIAHSIKYKGFNYGRLIHTAKTNTFFANCLKAASIMSGTKRDIALAYVYGLLCHFALDSKAHPYILYMACFKTDNDRDRQVSSASHSYFETAIDAQMLKIKRGLTPDMIRRQDLIDISSKNLGIVSQLFAYAFNRTFDQFNTAANVATSIRNFRFTNMCLQGEADIKLFALRTFEKNVVKASLLNGIMHSKDNSLDWDVINYENEEWCLPWDNTVTRTDSFIDIYDSAALFASKLINDADSVVNFNMNVDDLLQKIGNCSYITGLDCNEPYNMKFFRSKTKEIIQ